MKNGRQDRIAETLTKIYLFYIDSIADNNQKMKGKKEYERKNGRGSKQTVGCNFKSLNLPM